MHLQKPTSFSYFPAFFKVFPKALAAFFSICLIFPTVLLAENKNPISAKGFVEPKSEMHFDLPKKDAKEQCAEVERVIRECGDILKDGMMHKCGNVYVRSFYFYPLHDLSYGGLEPYLVIDQFGSYVASNILDKMTFVSSYQDNKIFETKDYDIKRSIKRDVAVFYNQNCRLKQINFY